MQSGDLKIFSIFSSMNGEVCNAHQGSLCTFIRLAGCNLRCEWCDTEYAQEEYVGFQVNAMDILSLVKDQGNKNITITGGEPMLQEEALESLLDILIFNGYNISVETNGSIPFIPQSSGIRRAGEISYVVDYKLPSSGEYLKMHHTTPWNKLRYLDWIKFVIQDRLDYETARAFMKGMRAKGSTVKFAMSPILDHLNANQLLEWLQQDRIFDVVISVQLHKLLALNEPE